MTNDTEGIMRKLIITAMLAIMMCGCSTSRKDGDDKWVLTQLNMFPAKFNVNTGEMWVLESTGWVRIENNYGRTIGGRDIPRPLIDDLERR